MDFDGDGQADIISGSYHPGDLYLFRGTSNGTFEPAEIIKDATGKNVNVGAAAAVFAADFGNTGLLDVVVGNIDGKLFLIRHRGTRDTPAFDLPMVLTADGKPIKLAGDAGPTVADWNGDGKLDLIVGDGSGEVRLFINRSSDRTPDFGTAEVLVARTSQSYTVPAKPDAPSPGMRAKPMVADFHGDGRLDLLVGDFSYSSNAEPEPQVAATPATQPADAQQRLRTALAT
ncbi:hypothetical protein BH09PLA1_BH09PLA1_29640 [soil metagenome]